MKGICTYVLEKKPKIMKGICTYVLVTTNES